MQSGEMVEIDGVSVRTEPCADYGQFIIVSVHMADGREVDVIREWGALPGISISHHVTPNGIRSAATRQEEPKS